MIRFFLAMVLCVTAAEAKTFLLRAVDVEMQGGWRYTKDPTQKGGREFLFADGTTFRTPAAAAVEIPHAGKWRVWVRSKDFAGDRPGSRWFSVRLGETKLERKFGTHGQEGENGWAWENGGELDLTAGPLLVVLGEACKHSARFESILFTDNLGYTPEGVSWELKKERAKVVRLEKPEGAEEIVSAGPLGVVEEKPAAVLESGVMRVGFHPAGGSVAVKVATKGDGGWEAAAEDLAAGVWTVLARPAENAPVFRRGEIYPDWDASQSPLHEFTVGKAKVKTRKRNHSTAPWESGQCLTLRPVVARQVDGKTVELSFAETPWGVLKSVWTMGEGKAGVKVRTTFKPVKPGHFSLGFHAPFAVKKEAADSWLLPFQFQGDRFPARPVLIMNAATPTPMVLVAKGGVSCVLSAEPEAIPYEWQRGDTARYGFGLRNERGEVQPMVYAPVMGLPGSRSDGSEVESSFRLRVEKAGWYPLYRQVADDDFKVRDYRTPTTFSMTDTVWNLIDLIRNEKAAAWDAKAKGSVQIESRNVVSQPSPLTYMSLYLLTGEEDLYRKFGRPSLEFMISRPSAHFSIEKEIGDRYYQHQPMRGPVKMYGAGNFASAFAMTQGRSPVFAELAFNDGKPRPTMGGHVQVFDDLVTLHRVTGEKRWLDEAVAAADAYLAKLPGAPLRDPGDHDFVNNRYAANWEGLLYLAEETGEKRFRDAAEAAARQLLTTIWTQPVIPDEEITLNPGGVYDHARGIWWWGDGKKRLGVYEGPASEGPIRTEPPKIAERKVPAWTVSNVGLGLEHPFTYVRGGGQANIMMSNWAPNLLRLAALSGDDAFRVAARNSMIGRYANYPGYYLDGQTDEFRRADYPSKGPDITTLYFHHIPAFAASVVDFLFTDAEVRSGGKVVFPAVRQYGYVWFDSRLWGHAPGSVYGEKAWPWLHRTAAKADDPSIDVLLAEGGGKFHVVLLNQTPDEREVKVSFDEKALGRDVEGAVLKRIADGVSGGPVTVKDGVAALRIKGRGLAVLTMEDVEIDVATHRVEPPQKLPMDPAKTGVAKTKVDGTPWEAAGTILTAPPFTERDLYVYLDAELGSLKSAELVWRTKDGGEKRLAAEAFPYEFTVGLAGEEAVEWHVELTLPDGRIAKSGISRHGD